MLKKSLLFLYLSKTFCLGKIVEFLDLETGKWEELSPTNYKIGRLSECYFKVFRFKTFTDGHKLILVEGIPTIFSWENIEQFNGRKI